MIFLYTSLLLLVCFFEVLRKKEIFIDFLSIFNLFFIFSYLIPAIMFLAEPDNIEKWKFLSVVPAAPKSLSTFLAILIFYSMLLLGFLIGSKRSIKFYPKLFFSLNEWQQFKIIALPFFAISFVAFGLYSHGHDGIVSTILSGKNIRAGRQLAGVYQNFFYFSSGLSISMLLFCGFSLFSKSSKLRTACALCFFVSFIFAFLFALGTAGRGKIGMVFLSVLFFWLNTQKPVFSAKIILTLAGTALFILLLVTYGKSAIWVMDAFREGGSEYWARFQEHQALFVSLDENSKTIDYLVSFSRNFDHPLASLYLAMHNPEIYQSPRLFFDWVRSFIDLIPGVSAPELIISSSPSALNRDYFGLDGYVPPGWVAMKIINGGVLWLICGTLIAGMVGGWLQKWLMINWNTSPMIPGLFIIFALFWLNNIIGPDPFMVLLKNLSSFLLLLFVVPFLKLRSREQARMTNFPKGESTEALKKT